MRINGKKQILIYLGYSPMGNGQWMMVRRIHAAIIRRDPRSHRVWALTEELDAAESARCLPVSEDRGFDLPFKNPYQDTSS